MSSVRVRLDHLVWAASELDAGSARMADLVGMAPRPGGSHPQWGTRNVLLGLENGAYLEVVAPDPALPVPDGGRGFGVESAGAGRLVTWAVRSADVHAAARGLASVGVDPGAVSSGSRVRPDGRVLEWVQTDPMRDRLSGTVPFVLDWGETVHPSTDLAAEAAVVGVVERITLRHADPERLEAALAVLNDPGGTPVDVDEGPPEVAASLLLVDGRRIVL